MTRLFIQFSAAILVAVLLSFAIDIVIFGRAMDRRFRENPPPFLDGIAAATQRQFEDVPRAALPSAVERYRTESGMPIELVPIDHARVRDGDRALLARGQTTHDVTFRPGPTTFIPVQKDHVLILGPLGGFPQPNAADTSLMLAVILLVVGLTGVVVTYPQVKRLRMLEKATARLAAGELHARVQMKGAGPIADVARRFDDMAERNQGLLKRQRELVQAVAHEIRTPISRIRYGLEMASIAEAPEQRSRCEAGVEEDLTELDELVGELLVYCRFDAGTAEMTMEPVCLDELVEELVERQKDHHPSLEIELSGPGRTRAQVHHRSFQRAVRNMLLNACRYAERKILVRVLDEGDFTLVEVHDDGPGVPSRDRPRIFEPFARTDESRSRKGGGAGLGLAIVQRIVTAHHGTVEVVESALGGARFISRWPNEPHVARRPRYRT